jgi:hypothetical protein
MELLNLYFSARFQTFDAIQPFFLVIIRFHYQFLRLVVRRPRLWILANDSFLTRTTHIPM